MQAIQTVQGKLLYLARQMLIDKDITKKEQGVFKDLIFGETQSLIDAYDDYLKKGTQLTLKTGLIKIIRKEKQNQSWQSGSGASKKSSKRQRGAIKVIIPPKNIQKLPAQMNRI